LADAVRPRGSTSFWPRYFAIFGLGLVGLLGLIPLAIPTARQQLAQMPELEIPLGLFVAFSFLNPLILLAVFTAAGVRLAPRVGLRSYLDERVVTGTPVFPRLREDLPIALLLGVLGGATLILLDIVLAPLIAPELAALEETQPRTIGFTLGVCCTAGSRKS
jgi:hypothetical protein